MSQRLSLPTTGVANSSVRVKNNQKSPLLRLPPEIRSRIWEYTLGYTIVRAHVPYSRSHKPRLRTSSDEPGIGMALLRSCRQVYSEAALMPMRLNTFAFEGVYDIKRAIKLLKTH